MGDTISLMQEGRREGARELFLLPRFKRRTSFFPLPPPLPLFSLLFSSLVCYLSLLPSLPFKSKGERTATRVIGRTDEAVTFSLPSGLGCYLFCFFVEAGGNIVRDLLERVRPLLLLQAFGVGNKQRGERTTRLIPSLLHLSHPFFFLFTTVQT